jgi:hypothetical protein
VKQRERECGIIEVKRTIKESPKGCCMKKFEIRFGKERLITPSGVGIVGMLLNKTELKNRVDKIKLRDNQAPQIKNSDVIFSYMGLLCQGKSDFEAIREMQEDPTAYQYALGIKQIPSSETLRQRMDMAKGKFRSAILEENVNLLKETHVEFTKCSEEHQWIPIDIDVSPFDNSNTKKEGVSYTYKGFDGYAPIFAYMGTEGYELNMEFRAGSDHCQKNTDAFLKETLLNAKKLTSEKLLVRLDSGNDSADNMEICFEEETSSDFIIKRNLRREKKEFWQTIAEENTKYPPKSPRDGKKVYIGSVYWYIKALDRKVRIAYKVTERTILADGQILLMPDLDVQTWWTSLEISEDEIIGLYKAHGTCEQFHSEIKTDMDLERLPSGYFDTNALILELAIIAYNILRLIGQESLKKDDVAIRHNVKRRRLRTVIQNLITIAARIVKHARVVYLELGKSNIWRFPFKRIYESFS